MRTAVQKVSKFVVQSPTQVFEPDDDDDDDDDDDGDDDDFFVCVCVCVSDVVGNRIVVRLTTVSRADARKARFSGRRPGFSCGSHTPNRTMSRASLSSLDLTPLDVSELSKAGETSPEARGAAGFPRFNGFESTWRRVTSWGA